MTEIMTSKLCLGVILLLPTVISGETVQEDWTNPESPDYTTTFTNGDTVTLSWTSYLYDDFSKYCASCDPESANLWVESGDYSHQIASPLPLFKSIPPR